MNEPSENIQLGHRDFEISHLQIASYGNRLTTSRIFPNERGQISESKDRWILLFLVFRREGFRLQLIDGRFDRGADGGLPEAAPLPLTEMIRGGDICGATLPAFVTFVDILMTNFAMTDHTVNIYKK